MQYQEFLTLTNSSFSYDEYAILIEPKYMSSKLDKQAFCKKYQKSNNNQPTINHKDILAEIIDSVKDLIKDRPWCNARMKQVIKNQKETVKNSYWLWDAVPINNRKDWFEYLPHYYQQRLLTERSNFLSNIGNDESFYLGIRKSELIIGKN